MAMAERGEIYALGWDVRGWRSRDQATAVARLVPGTEEVEWIGVSSPFQFQADTQPGVSDLLRPAVGDRAEACIRDAHTFVVAIDALLSFPDELTRLLNNDDAMSTVPSMEIDNPFAYRYCERWVHETFGRKPLSATFDKLGNNATLAIAISQSLEREGFTCIPQSGTDAPRSVIEVYPALVKQPGNGPQEAFPQIARHLPRGLEIGSDPYDAAICAIVGLAFSGEHDRLGLEPVIQPPDDLDVGEGWIYTVPTS